MNGLHGDFLEHIDGSRLITNDYKNSLRGGDCDEGVPDDVPRDHQQGVLLTMPQRDPAWGHWVSLSEGVPILRS